jgi:monoamine oxidase
MDGALRSGRRAAEELLARTRKLQRGKEDG